MTGTAQPHTSTSFAQERTGTPPGQPFLSVVIPAFNEATRLPASLDTVLAYLDGRDYPYEVIVVDDGSSDDTADLVEEMATTNASLRVMRNPHRGKGYAVRSGMLAATGRYILYSDADFSAPIEEVEKLLKYLTTNYDVAVGSREGQGARRFDEPFYRHLMGRVFNTFVRLAALPQFHDTQCGFKAFRREAAHELFRGVHLYADNAGDIKGPMFTAFDVEVLYLALKWGYKVKEIPVKWYYSKSANISPLKDSLRMLNDIAQVRLNDVRGRYKKRPGKSAAR